MYLFIFILSLTLHNSYGWDSEQLEVFDIVEEVKVNFYELLNLTQVQHKKITLQNI